MRDDTIRELLDRFVQVWPRVQGEEGPPPRPVPGYGPPPPPGPPMRPGERREAGRLAELIDTEARAEQRYLEAARTARGQTARSLERLALGCDRLLRRLRTEYELLTGDRPAPPPIQPRRAPGGLSALYRDAEDRRLRFLRAASETQVESLRLLYGDAAQQCLREQQTLRELLRRRR